MTHTKIASSHGYLDLWKVAALVAVLSMISVAVVLNVAPPATAPASCPAEENSGYYDEATDTITQKV